MATNRNESLALKLRTPAQIRASTETARHHAQGRSAQARAKRVQFQFGIPFRHLPAFFFRRKH